MVHHRRIHTHDDYRQQRHAYLHALDTVIRLIDDICEDRCPVVGLPEERPERQVQRLQKAKVPLSILAHVLRRASEQERPA